MPESSRVDRSFFERPTLQVARDLLGTRLVRLQNEIRLAGIIVEAEAYLRDDPACHGAPGLTLRNRVMFGPPGHAYVYLIYGYHCCVNAVCCPEGIAEAVLIRAIEPAFGTEFMHERRPVSKAQHLTSGPAKLCQAMDIDRQLDGSNLCEPQSPLFIAANPEVEKFRAERRPLVTTIRIGITRAAALPLRFYLDGSACVSQRLKHSAI